MNARSLVLRSLRHYWRTHLGVVLGATCATAVLVGALAVGDSVRLSLREQTLNRIGRIDAVLSVHERYFQSDLADRISAGLGGADLATMLLQQGLASVAGGSSRAAIVDAFGIDEDFFVLSPSGNRRPPPGPGQAFVNAALADQLGVVPGDEILLRVQKPSLLPHDLLLTRIDDISFALPLEVGAVLSEDDFGRFSLRASQVPPFNMFVSFPWLQERLQLEGWANAIAVGNAEGADGIVGSVVDGVVERANELLRSAWTLADAEIRISDVENSGLFELTSDRMFIEPPVAEAVARLDPALVGVLTYFVNELRYGSRATPYSTVSAIGLLSPDATPGDPSVTGILDLLPNDLGPDEIVLNEWIAEDLQASVGDTIEIDYYVTGPQLQLGEETRALQVRSIVPLAGAAADASLMPEIPGLTDVDNSRDWEPGIPIDLDRIRDKDEVYWDEHRGTPKAFVGLGSGQGMWSNRFGGLTAVRGPQSSAQSLSEQLQRDLDPAAVGLFFQDLRGPALTAGTSATDFGGLFLGLSFFLIAAALLLTSLMFVFGVEQRANEIGALMALGFRPAQLRRLFLGEALILAVIGGVAGALLGMGYTRGVLYGLGTLWRDAVGSTTLTFHPQVGTLVLGTVIAIATALVAIALTLRKTLSHSAVELLASRNGMPSRISRTEGRGRVSFWLAVGAPILALILVLVLGTTSDQAAGAFFGAGGLLLIGGLAACHRLLPRLGDASRSGIATVSALGIRNTGRRSGRSLATIALLASGTFLVVAVQANRLEPPRDPSQRQAGTGGFALFGRSTLPVLRNLGTESGRDTYGLDQEELDGVAIVPMRVRDGDDASCLNLSLPQNPRLVSVQPSALADREAFSFAATLAPETGASPENPWLSLDGDYGENVVPAIGDQASVTWTLHKSLGDTLSYVDERGRDFRVRIVGTVANSILQGNLVISEEHFQERFPSATGYRMFMIDAPADGRQQVETTLTSAFRDIGLELTSTSARLEAFNAVQNTYLLIFQALGGLGLLLGSVGLGMVVLRNVLERRSELAITSAVGYPSSSVRQLVWSEHGLLLGLGLGTGVLAALFAVLPGLGNDGLSLTPMIVLVALVGVSGVVWVWLASAWATRGPLLNALRDD